MNRIPRDAFAHYLGLGLHRSYEAVARHFSVSRRGIARLAKRQQWQERVAEVERKAQQSVDRSAQEAIEAVNDRHLRTAQVLLRKGLETLKERPLTPALAIRAIELGIRQEREIRGIASERPAPSSFELPPLRTAADIAAASAALVAAVAGGRVGVEDASRIGVLFDLHRRLLETADIEARVHKLEQEANVS